MHIQSFINGIAVGFLLGILFAPDKGDETRRRISRRASAIKDNIKNTYEDIADDVSNQIRQVRYKANQVLSRGQKKYNELGDQASTI